MIGTFMYEHLPGISYKQDVTRHPSAINVKFNITSYSFIKARRSSSVMRAGRNTRSH